MLIGQHTRQQAPSVTLSIAAQPLNAALRQGTLLAEVSQRVRWWCTAAAGAQAII
jgi:hypothetical protein